MFSKSYKLWAIEEKNLLIAVLLKFDFFHRKAGANDPVDLVDNFIKKMELEKFRSNEPLYQIGKDN